MEPTSDTDDRPTQHGRLDQTGNGGTHEANTVHAEAGTALPPDASAAAISGDTASFTVTRCPTCNSRFQITAQQREAAEGWVRCGQCQAVFSADQHLEAPLHVLQTAPKPQAETWPHQTPPQETLVLKTRKTRRSPTNGLWGLLGIVAVMGLFAQVLWLERNQLARNPHFAPFYSALCQQFDCRLAPMQDLPSIISLRLLVRDHSQYNNVLTLDMLIENRAPFPQPFPALQIHFTGLDDVIRAARTFQPQEYLGGDLDVIGLMPSNSPIQLQLELINPGPLSPNYTLSFVPAFPR